jgi:hypothetical protein
MNVVTVTGVRLAILVLAVLAVDGLLDAASRAPDIRIATVGGLLRIVLPLLVATIALARWKYSIPAIVGMLYGLEVADTAVMGVVDNGGSWLSFVNVALWALLRGSIAIWPVCVPYVLFVRRGRTSAADWS